MKKGMVFILTLFVSGLLIGLMPLLTPTVSAVNTNEFYVYAGGSSQWKVYQFWKTNMTKKTESVNYSGTINAIVTDSTYVYAGGTTTQKVIQYWRSNMTKKQETLAYGGNIYALTQDDTYIYAGGATINKVFQYWKTNLTKKAESLSTGGIIRALVQDSTYVYAGGDSEYVRKYFKSNLTLITSANYVGGILALTIDDTYIYGGGGTTQKVYQWWKSNLTKKAESANYGAMIRAMTSDLDYVYVGGNTIGKIFRLWKTNMTKSMESTSYGNHIIGMAIDNRYIYAGGYSTGRVYQYWLSNLTKRAESSFYSIVINAVATDVQVAPDSPSSFTATAFNRTRIDLLWTKGWGAEYTSIQAKLGSYPSNRTDGTNIYNNTGTTYSHTGLSPNNHWYYRAWSWNLTTNTWNLTYVQANTTTMVNVPPTFGTPSPANNSVNTWMIINWKIPISDEDGDLFNWTIECNNSQSSSANGASNGTKILDLVLAQYSSYRIWVNATDGYNWTRRWYGLTTTTISVVPSAPSFIAINVNVWQYVIPIALIAGLCGGLLGYKGRRGLIY